MDIQVVQTGDRARVFAGEPVPLGEPEDVPAPVPALVGLPRPPTATFAGRAEELARLAMLTESGHAVVTGPSGVGTSELALQFASARRERYSLVWWVTADASGSIEFGLAELARLLHPDGPVTGTDREVAIWALLWLRTHSGWLLVLDNVERRLHVNPLLEQATGGRVIVTTTREADWDPGFLRVGPLAPPDAVTLLLGLSGQRDDATAGILAEELGCLPRPLHLAGAYLRETRTELTTYLGDLRTDPAPSRVVSVTLTRIASAEPLAITILGVAACLAPDDLPRDVLHHLGDRASVERALGVLDSYRLIISTGPAVSVPRLVRSALPAAGPGTLRAALHALSESAPPGDAGAQPETWPRWSALSPHIDALAEACADEVGGAELAALLGRHALFDGAQGRTEAKYHAEIRALRIEEAAFGPNHPVVAVRLSNLANTLVSVGHPAGAEPLQRRALEITETMSGPGHPDVAVRLNNLALTLTRLARVAEAEPLQRRALEISERTLGPHHPTVAIRLGNLAASLAQLGRPAEAEALGRRALQIAEAELGPGHPDVAVRLTTIAESLEAQERTAESEPFLRRAMDIMTATYGPVHPRVAVARSNLGTCLLTLGRREEAVPLLRDAVTIAEAAFGPDHPETAAALSNLAATLNEREAEPLQRRALNILESLHPHGHPMGGTAADSLAETLQKLGRLEEAEALYRKAVAMTEAVYGPIHPAVALRLRHLARFLDATGRKAEAIDLLRRRLGQQ